MLIWRYREDVLYVTGCRRADFKRTKRFNIVEVTGPCFKTAGYDGKVVWLLCMTGLLQALCTQWEVVFFFNCGHVCLYQWLIQDTSSYHYTEYSFETSFQLWVKLEVKHIKAIFLTDECATGALQETNTCVDTNLLRYSDVVNKEVTKIHLVTRLTTSVSSFFQICSLSFVRLI